MHGRIVHPAPWLAAAQGPDASLRYSCSPACGPSRDFCNWLIISSHSRWTQIRGSEHLLSYRQAGMRTPEGAH